MKIAKDTLGLAAEFAVASELCRRNVYAQLTLGPRKRTDLLIEAETGMLRVQVKGAQADEWPGCKGIYGERIALIFVDYTNKEKSRRPDFYILTPEDWVQVVHRELRSKIEKGEVTIDEKNTPIWREKGRKKRRYEGTSIRPRMIIEYKEAWDKILVLVGQTPGTLC